MISKINNEESRLFIKEQRFGHLGCVLENGRPYVVPVNYLFIDGNIYIHTRTGLKIEAMKANPSVCLQTDEISEDSVGWTSAIAFGEFEEVTDDDSKDEILSRFYSAFPVFTPVEATPENGDGPEDVIVFRINIDELTGVREGY